MVSLDNSVVELAELFQSVDREQVVVCFHVAELLNLLPLETEGVHLS